MHSTLVGPHLRRDTVASVLVAIATLLPVSGQAGRIEGTVRLGGPAPTRTSISPYAGRLGGDVERTQPPPPTPEEIAVHLVIPDPIARPDSAGTSQPPPEIRQVSIRFDPRVLAIPVGTEVAFPNMDPVFHNVFSYSPTRRFDLGRYGKGRSRSVTFDEPGLVKVFCDVHASMSAYILVVDSPWVTQPDAGGNFAIDDVPAGTHRMTLWHPDRGEKTVEIEVGDGTVHVDLEL